MTTSASRKLISAPLTVDAAIEAVADYEKAISELEAFCGQPGAMQPARVRMAVMRARAQAIEAELNYILESCLAGDLLLSINQAAEAEGLRDRAEELVDTFAWGADAHEELRALTDTVG